MTVRDWDRVVAACQVLGGLEAVQEMRAEGKIPDAALWDGVASLTGALRRALFADDDLNLDPGDIVGAGSDG